MVEREGTHIFHMRKGWSIGERKRVKEEKNNNKKKKLI